MKARESKLDAHAEKLIAWFTPKAMGGEGLTLAQAQARLSELGCSCSLNALSSWWQRHQQARMQDKLLSDIASGARFNREMEKSLGENPPPELATLMQLLRTLTAQLAINGTADQDTLKLVGHLMALVLEHDKARSSYEIKRQDLELKERRVVLLEQKAARFDQAKAAMGDAALSEAEKQQRIRQIFGMS
jgi:hypothetical protein